MGFKDLRNSVYEKCHENASFFAETVEVRAENDSLWLSVPGVHIHWDATGEADAGLSDVETIRVRFNRAAIIELNNRFKQIGRGFQLRMSADKDPSRRPFVFSGEVIQRYEHKLRLRFERPRLIERGA